MYILRVIKGKENLVSSILFKYGFEVMKAAEKGFLTCKGKLSPELIDKFEGYIQEIIEVDEEKAKEILKERKNNDGPSKIKEGSAVEVISGFYEGFAGIARRVEDGRVLVDLNLFGKAVPVDISASDLRVLPADPWS